MLCCLPRRVCGQYTLAYNAAIIPIWPARKGETMTSIGRPMHMHWFTLTGQTGETILEIWMSFCGIYRMYIVSTTVY